MRMGAIMGMVVDLDLMPMQLGPRDLMRMESTTDMVDLDLTRVQIGLRDLICVGTLDLGVGLERLDG